MRKITYKPCNFYCILGRSGAGKTTIIEKINLNYGLSVLPSYTTRPKRHESDTDHTYIDEETYDKLPNKVATRTSKEGKYCITLDQIEKYNICVVDINGLKELKENYKGLKKIIAIYIDINMEESVNRMMWRGDNVNLIFNRAKREYLELQSNDFKTHIDKIVNGYSTFTYCKVFDYIKRCEEWE